MVQGIESKTVAGVVGAEGAVGIDGEASGIEDGVRMSWHGPEGDVLDGKELDSLAI